MSERFPVVIIVPVASGKRIVLSAVGSVTVKVVSKSFAVAPSKTIEESLNTAPVIAGLVRFVIAAKLPVVIIVPVASGIVIVLSAVGSVAKIVVSNESAVAPSKTRLFPIVSST